MCSTKFKRKGYPRWDFQVSGKLTALILNRAESICVVVIFGTIITLAMEMHLEVKIFVRIRKLLLPAEGNAED